MSAPGHVLVVGAGGIGCPTLWGLIEGGVPRATIIDHDLVELSNLPRQVLFSRDHIGTPKAPAAASVFADRDTEVRGVHARLDDANFEGLTEGVDVIVDATDGARTKDWLNQAAVHAGIPLVHAAGLRSEARMLVVPSHGRPCLACLFGRLEEETGSCADLGVWNGVVGVIGFRAAHAALRVLAGTPPAPRYEVLDFEAGRALSLQASADEACPVCHAPADALEPYPDAVPCAVPDAIVRSEATVTEVFDLRDVRCPLNLLRARRALGKAAIGDVLEFQLGEEGAATVPDGVAQLGHEIVHDEPQGVGRLLRVRIVEGAAHGASFPAEQLERFARQLVLPDLGAAGQRRLQAATVELTGSDVVAAIAARYLACSGVGIVTRKDDDRLTASVADVTWRPVRDHDGVHVTTEGAPAEASLAVAALLADRVQRHIVAPQDMRPSLTLSV